MGEEGPGHLVDVVVGADGPEVLNVVPEVRGGVGPVRNSYWFFIGRWGHTVKSVKDRRRLEGLIH